VHEVRERFGDTVTIDAIPGPSAVSTALSLAGFPADTYLFLGFPPHKKGRKTFFETVAESTYTTVFYESPHRIMKALESLTEVLPENRRIAICRELTKMHEEVVVGTAKEVHTHFIQRPDTVRGEFVVVVEATH
jgi:16S rRNA (cytidine1402-2'-O)-methyltransferase